MTYSGAIVAEAGTIRVIRIANMSARRPGNANRDRP